MDTRASEWWKERCTAELKAQANFNYMMESGSLPWRTLDRSKSQENFAESVKRLRTIDSENVASYYRRSKRKEEKESDKHTSSTSIIPSNPNTLRSTQAQRTFIHKVWDEN